MLEITPDDIARLSDTDLRTLIGLLCESELRSRGLSPAAVTWSGHQNSADGGLDVRVALPEGKTIEGFVPRVQTGFQVKKSPMPRAEILNEMRPKGALRPIIRDLTNRSGAYIIVSAESTSDMALRNRQDAMLEAVSDLPNAKELALDFYDQGRVASWVRNHAGIVLWVRGRVGRPLPRWRPYEAWAYAADGIEGEYLLDDAVRIRTASDKTETRLSPAAGIQQIRDQLRRPCSAVRLVGLSGVGKTRFVQALFDHRIGDSSLDPSLAFYTDLADGPDPSPTDVARNLIASRSRGILIVDNCPPDLHRHLSEECRVPESTVSVITVEYDIREDQPEGTEVFELEASSADLIERLLKQRFSHLSAIDLHTIGQFSGGNARIAIALAGTVGREETIAGMADEELFKRLFEQRHSPDKSLLIAAQGLSLVYSFHGEDTSQGDEAELFWLGAAIGKSTEEMFHSTAELGRRGLVQRRGVWRAVLPQAIANRLAARALQDNPTANIENSLVNNAPERLLKSFSRRLGYLHDSPEARQIVRRWLGVGGRLGNVLSLNDLGSSIFRNVAPVDPEATISTLERALLASPGGDSAEESSRYVPLLISLAYDAKDFERCVALLAKIAADAANGSRESIRQGANDASKALTSLFTIQLSGTHASPEQRESVIRSFLDSTNPAQRELGLNALAGALEAQYFGPVFNLGFGARSRDLGYWPKSRDEVIGWFGRFLKFAQDLACSSHVEALRVRTIIADKFRGLWTSAQMYDDLEGVCRSISKKGLWIEGWAAVRETTYYDSKGFSPELFGRLASIEAFLQPQGTVQRVRSIVLAKSASYVGTALVGDANENFSSDYYRLQDVAYELGRSVALEGGAFEELLPELVRAQGEQVWNFGRGLAQGARDPVALWRQLVDQLKSTPKQSASHVVFSGFLSGLGQMNEPLAGSLLDEAIEDDLLGEWYPALEMATGAINTLGLSRLIRSLDLGRAPIRTYWNLVGGGVTNGLAGQDFNRLLLKISDRADGADVAIEILSMRLSFSRDRSSPEELVEIGCELLRRRRLGAMHPGLTYNLQQVGKYCLVGEQGASAVREVCGELRDAISRHEASAWGHDDLLQILFRAQPFAVLQSLCSGDAATARVGVMVMENARLLHPHAFDAIPEEELLRWCDELPNVRYPIAAAGVVAVRDEADGPHWTDIARKILEKSPDRVGGLKEFIRQFSLPRWDPSRAAEVQSKLRLLDEMAVYSDPGLVEFAVDEKNRLSEAMAAAREVSPPVYMDLDEGFE